MRFGEDSMVWVIEVVLAKGAAPWCVRSRRKVAVVGFVRTVPTSNGWADPIVEPVGAVVTRLDRPPLVLVSRSVVLTCLPLWTPEPSCSSVLCHINCRERGS